MIGAHQPQNKSRGLLITIFRWAAALAVFAILFHFLPVAPLRTALAKVPPIRFAIVLMVYLCAHTVGIAKWRMVVNTAGSQLDFSTSAQCYLGGLFGTLFLPSIIGGDVVRIAVGLRRSPRPAAVLAGNVVDRFLDVAAQATLVLIGLILLPGSLPEQFSAAARKILLICAAVVFAMSFLFFCFAESNFRRTITPLLAPICAATSRAAFGAAASANSGFRLAARRTDSRNVHFIERATCDFVRPV